MAPKSSTRKSRKTAILSKGGKDFIIPEKEKKELERKGKIDPEQRKREEGQAKEAGTDPATVEAQRRLDIEDAEVKLRGEKRAAAEAEAPTEEISVGAAPVVAEGEEGEPLSRTQEKAIANINKQRVKEGKSEFLTPEEQRNRLDEFAEETSFSAVLQRFKDEPLKSIGENLPLAAGTGILGTGVNLIGKSATLLLNTKIIGTIIGADFLATWLSSDNYHFQNGAAANLLIEAYENDPSEANKQETITELKELQSELEFVGGKTKFSAYFNPAVLVTGKGKTWIMNQEAAEENLQRKIDAIAISDPVNIANQNLFFEENRNRKLGIE